MYYTCIHLLASTAASRTWPDTDGFLRRTRRERTRVPSRKTDRGPLDDRSLNQYRLVRLVHNRKTSTVTPE